MDVREEQRVGNIQLRLRESEGSGQEQNFVRRKMVQQNLRRQRESRDFHSMDIRRWEGFRSSGDLQTVCVRASVSLSQRVGAVQEGGFSPSSVEAHPCRALLLLVCRSFPIH